MAQWVGTPEQHLERIRLARARRDEELNREILATREAGASVQAIAGAARFTRQNVYAILEKMGYRPPGST